MLTYTQSLDQIKLCERDLMLCEGADDYNNQEDFLRAFDAFQEAKYYHLRYFGAPTKRNGEWA